MPIKFKLHDLKTAPSKSTQLLKKLIGSKGNNGFYSVISESPEALMAYNDLHRAFSATSFSNEEKHVIWQTINVEHECNFCVPAHTAMATRASIKEHVINALRNETPLQELKLEELRKFTLILVRNRGKANDDEINAFLSAGYSKKNILELVIGIAEKVLSNYVNYLAQTPVDKQFKKFIWSKKK